MHRSQKSSENGLPAGRFRRNRHPHPVFSNTDCLRHIFSFLNLSDRTAVEQVCKEWRRILSGVPLPPAQLAITCGRSYPPKLCIQFSGRMAHLQFVPYEPEALTGFRPPICQDVSGIGRDAADIERAVNAFFHRLLSSHGYAVSEVIFGGDTYRVHGTEAALTEAEIPLLQPTLLRDLAEYARNNLKSISLRRIFVPSETWPVLGDVVETLATEGKLQKLCMHDVSSRESRSECFMPLAMSLNRLKRFACSSITLPMLTAIGEAAAIVEKERAENSQRPRLHEFSLPLRQNYLITNRLPDTQYLKAVKAGDVIDLELHILDYRESGMAAAVSEALRLAGSRIRMLDVRLWIREGLYHRHALPSPIADMLPAIDYVIDSLQEFRLYGSELCLNDADLSVLVASLSVAPNLRRLSLGKVGCRKLNNHKPLGNLIQLEWLFLSYFPRLDDTQFIQIMDRLINLKRLWMLEIPIVTNSAIMSVIGRLEAFEIGKCNSFNIRKFFHQFLESRINLLGNAEAAAIDRLEFVKIRYCDRSDLKILHRAIPRFRGLDIRVVITGYHEAAFILKNHEKWLGISSIRLPWYNCQFCDADLVH